MVLAIEIDRDRIAAFCRRWKITEFSFFGSVLRDDFRPDSGVDVLVEFVPGHVPGFAFFNMQEELKGILGREVDVVTRGGLRNPFRRHDILTTKRVFYVA